MFYYLSLKKILGDEFYQIFKIAFFVLISAILELISVLMISFIIVNANNLVEVINLFNELISTLYSDFFIDDLTSIFFIVLIYISISVFTYLIIIRYASFRIHLMVSNVRSKIVHRLLNNNFFIEHDQEYSKVISNIIYDASQFGASLIDLVHLISRLCLTMIILGWLLLVNTVTTLIIITLLTALYLAIHLIITPRIRYSGKNIATFNALLIKELSNIFGYIREIIFYNQQDSISKQLGGINNKIAISTGSKSFLVNMPRFIVDSLLLIILASFVLIANSSQKDFVLFYSLLATYGIASIKLLPAVQNIFYYSQQILARRPNLENLVGFFESRQDVLNTHKTVEKAYVPEFRKQIILKDISLEYQDQDKILSNISFTINQGDKIAIVGPSGSGKSTLMNVIIGITNPTSGYISMDGTKIEESNIGSFRENISYIPQNIFLTEGTIKDNVTLFSGDEFKELRYQNALKESGLSFILNKSHHNDQTLISDRSNNLSGGEKQCIGIARALYGGRHIIALDEATSSMDTDMASKITNLILEKWETIVCVTHQSFLLEKFNRIIVMQHGKIEDFGDYNELLNKNDYLRNLILKNL